MIEKLQENKRNLQKQGANYYSIVKIKNKIKTCQQVLKWRKKAKKNQQNQHN